MPGYQNYAKTDIQTSDPRAVIVLLYEGAARFLNKASSALAANERLIASEQVLKTQKIIQFLRSSLDFNEGGEIAENLDRLYAYMRDTLNEANLHCSVEKIEEVAGLLKPLGTAWKEIAHDPEATAALKTRQAGILRGEGIPATALATAPPTLAPQADGNAPDIYSPAPKPSKTVDDISLSAASSVSEQESPLPAAPLPSRAPGLAAAGRAAYGLR